MLIAIAIYKLDKEHTFQKVKLAQREKGLFNYDPLNFAENNIIAKLDSSMILNKIYSFQLNNEYYYVKPHADHSILTLMLSKKKLERAELNHLFNNIKIVYEKPAIQTTLDDIVTNPLGYIGKDILITEIQGQLDEVKAIAIDSINTLLARGETLDEIEQKTQQFVADSAIFVDRTKKLNSCCNLF